ncbi:hypothetical protein AO260_08550 [Pseudomonas sp. ABAC21]|nr:hypothetical protein AO260_08550 [Pseudomonas sp. ABAC21]NMZ51788.1 hypothetical protein [Pseudomonas poae]
MPTPQASKGTADAAKADSSSSLTVSLGHDAKSSEDVGGGEAPSTKQESETVKELKKQIEQLQKQLQQQQQALQKAQSSTENAEAKAVTIAAAQVQVASTSAALQTVSAALLQAVTSEGKSSSGSIVSTTA